ncbi:unnamed protein product [Mortierella alpina]
MSTTMVSQEATLRHSGTFVPQERSFSLRNGIVIKAKHWRTGDENARPEIAANSLLSMGSLTMRAHLIYLLQKLGSSEPVEIVALDLAGHGLSSHRTTEDYALWRYVEDADQVVEQLGWQRHAIIGHSMGGAISTIYAGLYESRVTLCVLLDNFGPLTRSVEDQPQHLLEHIAEKKALTAKRLPFHPTIDSACNARSQGGAYGIKPEYARVLMSRGLRPMERTMEDGTVVQGWTWTTDRLLTIRSAQSMSDDFAKAFMSRICCPVLCALAEGGLLGMIEVTEERVSWMHKARVTVVGAAGNHSVHMEDAPMISEKVCSWILEQDRELARL